MHLNLFFIFPISFLFRFNFDNFFSFIFQIINYFSGHDLFAIEFLISIMVFLTSRSSVLFFLKSACCLITISKLFSIYWNIFSIRFHIVIIMTLVFEVIGDLVLLFDFFWLLFIVSCVCVFNWGLPICLGWHLYSFFKVNLRLFLSHTWEY